MTPIAELKRKAFQDAFEKTWTKRQRMKKKAREMYNLLVRAEPLLSIAHMDADKNKQMADWIYEFGQLEQYINAPGK